MLEWLKRRGAPKAGPDYRHIDSRQKAEDLCKRGELKKLLLLPAEFGGQDVPPNVIYVPEIAVELKARLDVNTIRPMAQKGLVSTYTATPEYEGKSVVPLLIRVLATDPGRFEGTINIWGRALEQKTAPTSGEEVRDQPVFSLATTSLEGLTPEDFVRAYISDYETWNNFAHESSERDPSASMDVAESAYATLMTKFCPPELSHQPIAFGSDSSHDDRLEVIVGVEPTADTCLVKTRRTESAGKLTMAYDYEYHLKQIGQRWFLTSVLYVDQDGKYEEL